MEFCFELLKRIERCPSAEIVTGFELGKELSSGQATDPQRQGETGRITKEVASQALVSTAIQKQVRQNKLLWIVRIRYVSPQCDTHKRIQFKHMMVLDGELKTTSFCSPQVIASRRLSSSSLPETKQK